MVVCRPDRIVLKQRKYCLDIRINNNNQRKLSAPKNGEMTRKIMESASCEAEFTFYRHKKQVFHLKSEQASFEYEG